MAFLDLFRARCPSCGKRGLRTVEWFRATVLIDGRRAPASWFYERCPSCGARFRNDLGKPRAVASDQDWRRDVERQ